MSVADTALPPFHLAFPVHSLAAAREFYGELLGCPEGRSSDAWVDFNFYGHQIVAQGDNRQQQKHYHFQRENLCLARRRI